MIFESFKCDHMECGPGDGECLPEETRWHGLDYTQHCIDDTPWAPYSYVMIFVYPVGIPVFYLYQLWPYLKSYSKYLDERKKAKEAGKLFKDEDAPEGQIDWRKIPKELGFLCTNYDQDLFYFELVARGCSPGLFISNVF